MIDIFLEIEKKHNLLDASINGFNYWIYIRDKVCNHIEEIDSRFMTINIFNSRLDKTMGSKVFSLVDTNITMGTLVDAFINCTIKNPFFKVQKKDILIFPSPRRILIDSKYYAYWTDIIQDSFNEIAVSAEFLNVVTHFKPYWNPNVIELDYFDIYPILARTITPCVKKKIKIMIQKESIKLSLLFQNEMKIVLSSNYFENLIMPRYYAWYLKKKKLKKFISMISPKVIVEVCGYSTNNLIINEIADELNIVTVEMQHGIMGFDHIAYNYLSKKRMKQHPKKLFVYSNYWKQHCRFPIGENNIIPVGYYYAEMQKQKFPRQSYDEEIVRILVLSQPVFHEKFINALKYCIDSLELESIQYRIIIKPHPTERNRLDEWQECLGKKNIEVINDPEISLYSLFSESDIQVGATSTSIYEGLIYNLKTIIFNFGNAKDQMKDLIDDGTAVLCSEYKEFGKIIKKINMKNESYDSSLYFMKDAARNVTLEIRKILLSQ